MNHKESIVKQMTEQERDWIKQHKIPLLKVYETRTNANATITNQSELFIYCMECRKYACRESLRNGAKEFCKEHVKCDCTNAFDKYASLYDLNQPKKKPVNRRTIKINTEIEIEVDNDTNVSDGKQELITKLFEMLDKPYDPEDYDENATQEEALITEIETLMAGRDLWKSRYEKLKAKS